MLPSRLFRNLGIPPPLRSLIVPHPALSPSVVVQLRLRCGLFPRALSTNTHSRANSSPLSEASSSSSRALHKNAQSNPEVQSSSSSTPVAASQQLKAEDPPEPRLSLTFTCTVPDCSERSTHQFTKRAYERGIVLVTCPKCKNRHLIADHIGWFKQTEGTEDGQLKTIEDLMRAKGEKVTRGRLDAGGVVEYVE